MTRIENLSAYEPTVHSFGSTIALSFDGVALSVTRQLRERLESLSSTGHNH
jgi:hypothetical protein